MQRTPRSVKSRPAKPTGLGNAKHTKVTNIAIAGVGALVVCGLGTVFVQDQRAEADNAEAVATYTPATTYTPPPAPDTTLFIGDSYTVGWGADGDGTRWTSIVADEMGWLEANYGQGGTGYVTTSGRDGCGREVCPTYPDRLAESKGQVGPEVIVIAGGQNDFTAYADDPDTVEDAIRETFTQATNLYPHAKIVAVGPSTPNRVSDRVMAMDDAVRGAAQSVGATYVSLIDPPVIEDDMVLEDGAHVGVKGHAAIAKRVLDVLHDGN